MARSVSCEDHGPMLHIPRYHEWRCRVKGCRARISELKVRKLILMPAKARDLEHPDD